MNIRSSKTPTSGTEIQAIIQARRLCNEIFFQVDKRRTTKRGRKKKLDYLGDFYPIDPAPFFQTKCENLFFIFFCFVSPV